jgi:O-antigen/teichoic acid export membrane protein
MIKKIKSTTYALLRKSEAWTKTDMVYLVRGGSWLTFGKLIGAISGFILAILYANFLTKEDYATYKYLLSIAGLFSIITLPGIETSMIKSIAKGFEGSYKQGLATRLKWSAFGSLITILIAIYYYFNHNHTLAIGLIIIIFTSPIVNTFSMISLLQGKKLWRTSAILNSTKSLILLFATAITILFFPNALSLLLVSYSVTALIQIIYFKILLKRYSLNDKQDNECIKLGKHLSLMSALGVFSEHIDKIIIWKFLGAHDLAVYSFALVPVNQFKDFLRSVSILAFPKIVQQKSDISIKTLPPKLIKLSFILLLFVAFYILLAPWLFNVLFPQYLSSVKYTQLFSLTWILFPQRLLTHIFVSTSNTKVLYMLQIIEPLIKIICYFTLIPIFNIYGAIIATLFSGLMSLIFIIYFIKKKA